MKRMECIESLMQWLPSDALVVANVGDTSHMLFQKRHSDGNLYQANMGSCSGISLGLALALPRRKIVALDGDGNLLFNSSALADIANENPRNLVIIVLDNGRYESGGGLPTATAGRADLELIAKGCGIENATTAQTNEEFSEAAERALTGGSLAFVVAKIEKGGWVPFEAVPPLTLDGFEAKYRFIRYIEDTEGISVMHPARGSKIVMPRPEPRGDIRGDGPIRPIEAGRRFPVKREVPRSGH